MKEKGRLDNKVAIVTASTAGIGRAIAIMFASEGARVVINGRNKKPGRDVLGKCREHGQAELVLGDVSRSETWKEIRDVTLKKFGRIDILVNNAAHFFFKPALAITEEEWAMSMNISLKSAWLGAKTCIPEMIERKGGNIVNISSVHGIDPGEDVCSYSTAKGGMNMLTRSLAIDYGKQNIRVNTVSPGPIITLGNTEHRKDPKLTEEWFRKLSVDFIGRPKDVAHGVVYIASDEARFVTGANLVIDGGWTLG